VAAARGWVGQAGFPAWAAVASADAAWAVPVWGNPASADRLREARETVAARGEARGRAREARIVADPTRVHRASVGRVGVDRGQVLPASGDRVGVGPARVLPAAVDPASGRGVAGDVDPARMDPARRAGRASDRELRAEALWARRRQKTLSKAPRRASVSRARELSRARFTFRYSGGPSQR
jgi:hypothetical protein